MLYEAGVFWGSSKNIQVKLYFISVDITIELSNFIVMSVINGVSHKDRKEKYIQHEFCAKAPGAALYLLPNQHGMMQCWKEVWHGPGSSRAVLTVFSISFDVNQPTAVLFRLVISTSLNCLLFQNLCMYGTSLDNSGIHCVAHYGHLPHLSPQGTEFTSICRDVIIYKVAVAAKWIWGSTLCTIFLTQSVCLD